MIILFDELETKFDSLGLGVLKDATQCTVTESLNDEFTLEMQYSISGKLYNKLNINKIIYAKANPYDEPQPFRISSISKPIKGFVKIKANHISYDMNGIPVKAIDAATLADVFNEIDKNSLIQNKFKFRTDMFASRSFKTTQPYNLRAILMGDEENSLVGVYDAELKFDKFDVHLLGKRGYNRGAKICYGQNMTDLTHEITDDKLYNGIFPYYHKESTETQTETEETFKKAYIVGTKEYAEDWLSFTENGEAYHPLDATPVQIASEGDHYEEVYSWNTSYQRFEKKIYNESVTLIENVISPGWIKIVWSGFPNVKCVANAKGYYKKMTDTDWGDIKGVGDVIFEGNILREGLSGIASNMIIYYSEVIPSTKESTTKEVNDIKEVTLDDPIIWLNTIDSKSMTHDRILMVDLTDKFEESEPTKEQLKQKAEEYISEYKLGNINTNTKVSFVEINENQNKFKNFSHVELGDPVQIVYNDLGVNTELRVISTVYDAIAEKYTSVELGTKKDKFSSQSVINGDNITSLTNDAGYADVTTVNKLIAQTITAEFINAANATLSKAQIEELKVSKIEMPGVIEASQYVVDELVAKMLTAENAKIAKTLEAGTVKVNGEINVIGGSISITDSESEEDTKTYFEVDKRGNLKANSVDITGGSLQIGENFSVDNAGNMQARDVTLSGDLSISKGNIYISEEGDILKYFQVKNNGDMNAANASINTLTAVHRIEFEFNDIGTDSEIESAGKIIIKNSNEGSTAGFIIDNGGASERDYNVGVYASKPTDTGAGSAKCAVTIGPRTNDDPDVFRLPNKDVTVIMKSTNTVSHASITMTGIVNCLDSLSSASYTFHFPRSSTANSWTINEIIVDGRVLAWSDFTFYRNSSITAITPGTAENEFSLGHFLPYDETKNLGSNSHKWQAVFSLTGTIQTSDATLKENITDISDKYSAMFDELRPVSYKLIGESHDRLHLGFIAQEVEEAMDHNNITSMEFGGLCYDIDENQNKKYSLRYGEFIPLMAMEIQKLKRKIQELENKEEQTE